MANLMHSFLNIGWGKSVNFGGVRSSTYHWKLFALRAKPNMDIRVQATGHCDSLLDEKTAEVPSKDVIIVAGDLNGHVGATKGGYSCHGGFGYGSRNADGERLLEYAESYNLTIVNTAFRECDSHLISFWEHQGSIDFVLVKDRDRSLVTDAKVVPYETVAPQRRPLICTLKIASPRLKQVERCGAARIKWWRMREKEAAVISRVRLPRVTSVDETWKKATDAIRQAARLELGITKPGRRKVVAVAKATHYGDFNEKLEPCDICTAIAVSVPTC
ncbi:unnamed protein product [Heligmosomoides polygyrus]|uniref:Endo/exonuclease/phosphatase domain-containing protein n=1 Tax=Heligmosomoides polygyrus TaxID=6339 RepID=A0A183GHL1_HELPZ|nr:unnamed protein product [Heligmosomoides polygyrus]